MFDFHKNHKRLVNTALIVFVVLSLFIAVAPAYEMQKVKPLPTQPELTPDEQAGLNIFISEGCVACHTQQVRNIEMDQIWGERPSMPSDYYYSKQRQDVWRQTPSLLGSERTGPDLTNVGQRQPGKDWHLIHLYNPRLVVRESIMPSYPWLFEVRDTNTIHNDDVVISVNNKYFNKEGYKIVATKEVLQLVAYLQSLKQAPLMAEAPPEFIPSIKPKNSTEQVSQEVMALPDGEKLYKNTCAACHQPNGLGIEGAFPPLAGSAIVNDKSHEKLVQIILMGYDARPEYGQMPSFADQLDDAEIAAIVNHERSSWGNEAPTVSAEDVKKIRDFVIQQANE